jgi:hypothetical protein
VFEELDGGGGQTREAPKGGALSREMLHDLSAAVVEQRALGNTSGKMIGWIFNRVRPARIELGAWDASV